MLTAMRQWGDTWAAPNGAPLEVVHDACGEVLHVTPVCGACGDVVDARGVHARPGLGAAPGDFERTALAAP